MARILARRLRFSCQALESVTSLDVTRRVAHRLLRLAGQWGVAGKHSGVLIPLRLTQGDLAEMVGASRMSISRAMNYFKERKWISYNRQCRVTIHDVGALRCQ